MGNHNKDKKLRYRKQFLKDLLVQDIPIGLDLGPRANHFLSRVYYHDHHSKFNTPNIPYIKERIKNSYNRNLFYD